MIYDNCYRLIKAAVDNKLIQTVPENAFSLVKKTGCLNRVKRLNEGDLLIYRNAGDDQKKYPEGWYATSFYDATDELTVDETGQEELMYELMRHDCLPVLLNEKEFFDMMKAFDFGQN